MTTHPLTRLQIACDKLNVARGPEAVSNALTAYNTLSTARAAQEIEALLGQGESLVETCGEVVDQATADDGAWLVGALAGLDDAEAIFDSWDATTAAEVVRNGGEEVKVQVVHTASHIARAVVPSSRGDKAYVCTVIDHGQGDLTATGCSCMDALRHGGGCKHERSAVAAAWTLRGLDGEVWVPCLKTSRKARRTA